MKPARIVITGMAVLAACGLLGMVSPAVQASSVLAVTWTRQFPAASPPARVGASMAYDAATRSVVLFGGGRGLTGTSSATWTWDGSTWAEQHPATHPPAGSFASMAYDAATRSVVLWGGDLADGADLTSTWTWNGSTWTKQHPATHPSGRSDASMAYDAATGNIVLFGGVNFGGPSGHVQYLADTWTWNGSTWTKQSPATHPTARYSASMAYDAATHSVVLFGGFHPKHGLDSTWTWG